MKTSRLNSVI